MDTTSGSFLTLGDRIPDLALPALDGGTVHLHDFLGRRCILFMWASW